MIPNDLPVSQFFGRAGAATPPTLFIVPIMLALLFLPLIDLFAGVPARLQRSVRPSRPSTAKPADAQPAGKPRSAP